MKSKVKWTRGNMYGAQKGLRIMMLLGLIPWVTRWADMWQKRFPKYDPNGTSE